MSQIVYRISLLDRKNSGYGTHIRRIEIEIGQPGKYDVAIQEMQDYANRLDPTDFISP